MIRHNFLANATAAQLFIDGVKKLKDPALFPWPGRTDLSMYDVFVFWHHQSMMLMTPPGQTDRNAAHSGPAFLPWHRYFLIRLEGMLQQAVDDSSFRIPYWDWSADAALPNPATSPLWDMANLGQFIGVEWPVRLVMNPVTGNLQMVSRQLERGIGAAGALPGRDSVRATVRDETVYDMNPLNSSSPGGIRTLVEGWIGSTRIHNNVHVWVGGDMGLSSSPNDPVFFLHHCNVDRIWAAWQAKHESAAYVPDMTEPTSLQFHRLDDPLYSVFEEQVTPRNMLDYRAYYEYDSLSDLIAA
jgi:tyrosinase